MRTAVVILNWNGKNYLERFLPGLIASVKDDDAEVIVADNASTDGSQEWLKANYPDIWLIQLDRNYGFTGGYNRAFEHVIAGPQGAADYVVPEFFLLINSDVEVSEGWFYPLQEWMEYHPDCAACAPKLLSYDNKDEFEYAGAAGGYLDMFCFPFCRGRVMSRIEVDEGQYDDPYEILWGSGACLMVRSTVWKDLGGLDESFFAHMEEIDFCWRARLAGHKVCYVPRSSVYHVGGGTLPQESPFKLKLNYRNNLTMMRKNLGKAYVLRNLFDVLAVTAPEYSVSTDDFLSCLEVFYELPEGLRGTLLNSCSSEAIQMAKRHMRIRLFIDWCASMVYLLKGKTSYWKAVRQAHKEYRKNKPELDFDELREFLQEDIQNGCCKSRACLRIDLDRKTNDRVKLVGIIDAPIITLSIVARDRVFEILDDLITD